MGFLLTLTNLDSEQKAAENKQAFSVFEQKHSKGASLEVTPTTRDGTTCTISLTLNQF